MLLKINTSTTCLYLQKVGIVYGNLECICIIPIGKHLCYPLYLPYILLFRYCVVVLLLFVCVNNDCI